MKSTLIRTAVLASLITALAVSAVAYYALPHTSAQAHNQGRRRLPIKRRPRPNQGPRSSAARTTRKPVIPQ